jgi:hypothetical protein
VRNHLSSSLLSKNLKIKIYRTIILPTIVLYGCETWSFTLRKERRLRVFENKLLRRIVGPERDEVTGEWRKLHKEGLNPRTTEQKTSYFDCTVSFLYPHFLIILSTFFFPNLIPRLI